jgi:hypothetical protein
MPGGHSTLNTVVLGEGVSKSKYTPYCGHHSSQGLPDQLQVNGYSSYYIERC